MHMKSAEQKKDESVAGGCATCGCAVVIVALNIAILCLTIAAVVWVLRICGVGI